MKDVLDLDLDLDLDWSRLSRPPDQNNVFLDLNIFVLSFPDVKTSERTTEDQKRVRSFRNDSRKRFGGGSVHGTSRSKVVDERQDREDGLGR